MCLTSIQPVFTTEVLKELKKNRVKYVECYKEVMVRRTICKVKGKKVLVISKYIPHTFKHGNNINEKSGSIWYGVSGLYPTGFHSYLNIGDSPITLHSAVMTSGYSGYYQVKVWIPVKDIILLGKQYECKCVVSQSFTFRKPKEGKIVKLIDYVQKVKRRKK